MTHDEWYENHFVAGNIRSTYEPMFLHDRDRIVSREGWEAALKYANERQAKTQTVPELSERVMRPYEPGLD